MGKVNIEDLANIRERQSSMIAIRQGLGRVKINVHMGTCGIAAGARNIMMEVLKEIDSRNLGDVLVMNSGCAGVCGQEPMMTVEISGEPRPVLYVYLTADKVKKIFDAHILKGQVVTELVQAAGTGKTH
jgi:NADP-reducing hydrogenase subunit HndB